MVAVAKQNNVHISYRKAGLVCDLVRGKKAKAAVVLLQNTPKKAARLLLKLLNSAIANATNNFGMKIDDLYVLNIVANQAPTIKRTLPRAKGSADLLKKRHSHFVIMVSDNLDDKKLLHKGFKSNAKKKFVDKSIERALNLNPAALKENSGYTESSVDLESLLKESAPNKNRAEEPVVSLEEKKEDNNKGGEK